MRTRFRCTYRVYYEDTDLAGVVYHANYLRYMERARTEWLRHLGCEQDELKAVEHAVFVVVDANVQFRAPARFNDLIEVDVKLERARRASVELCQHVYRQGDVPGPPAAGLEWLCRATIRIACVDAGSLKPRGIPAGLMAKINHER